MCVCVDNRVCCVDDRVCDVLMLIGVGVGVGVPWCECQGRIRRIAWCEAPLSLNRGVMC